MTKTRAERLTQEIRSHRALVFNIINLMKGFHKSFSHIPIDPHHKKHLEMLIYNLEMGRAWTGKLLNLLGAEYPYPKADKVEDIPAATDTDVPESVSEQLNSVASQLDNLEGKEVSISFYNLHLQILNDFRDAMEPIIEEPKHMNGDIAEIFMSREVVDEDMSRSGVLMANHLKSTIDHYTAATFNAGFLIGFLRGLTPQEDKDTMPVMSPIDDPTIESRN